MAAKPVIAMIAVVGLASFGDAPAIGQTPTCVSQDPDTRQSCVRLIDTSRSPYGEAYYLKFKNTCSTSFTINYAKIGGATGEWWIGSRTESVKTCYSGQNGIADCTDLDWWADC